MNYTIPVFSSLCFLFLAACERYSTDIEYDAKPSESVVEKMENSPRVLMTTSKGDIEIELYADKAPITVKNFLNYVKADHYDGTVFHRVMSDFMIQGGGFALEEGNIIEKATGSEIKNESENGLSNLTGTIAMARRGDPNSATAQFFINVEDNSNLDYSSGNGGYTVFGKVVEGMDVVNQIREVETGIRPLGMMHPMTKKIAVQQTQNVPLEPVVIERIDLID